MDASKDMEELLNRIYMPSVFYFPKELFPNLSLETKKVLKEYQFFEDIGIVKANGDIGSLSKSINALEIYKKDNILEANVFQLLEMKERLGNESFNFLFEKYLSNVKAWVKAYNWLLDNFEKQITETSKKEKSLFDYQGKTLDKHLTKLNQKFRFNFNNTTATNLMDVLSKNKKTFPFDKSVYNNLKRGANKSNQNKDDISLKKDEKQILLTEKEADEYLLKTVFNIHTA